MKTRGLFGAAIALVLGMTLSGAVSGVMALGSYRAVEPAATTDDLVFIHQSCGRSWLDNSLREALLAKDYVDEYHDISDGVDVPPDAGRPDSLQQYGPLRASLGCSGGNERLCFTRVRDSIDGRPPGDHTNMHHWILWFNDYLESVKSYDAKDGINRMIMFKSSPSASSIHGDGAEPGDPFSSARTLANYKAVFRHPDGRGNTYSRNGHTYKPLEDIFAENPDTLFILVTAPPTHYAPWDVSSNASAHRARQFNNWLKNDWLASYNAAYPWLHNVAVFDWFDVLAYLDDHPVHPNRLKVEYGGASGDSRPNGAANAYSTQVFATGLDNFIDSAWGYFLSGESDSHKIASKWKLRPGETVIYTLVVQSLAAPPTATVCLTDVVPSGLVYVSGTLTAAAGIVTETSAPTLTWIGPTTFTPPVIVSYAAIVTSTDVRAITNTAVIAAQGYRTITAAATIIASRSIVYVPVVLRSYEPPDPGLDTLAPSAPGNLKATAVSPNQVNLTWTASHDNVGVERYHIWRGGSEIGITMKTGYSDTEPKTSRQYSYTVTAYDAAGNVSEHSKVITVTTPAIGETLSYVDLVKRLTDLEYLATLPQPGEECAQWSSYDRSSIYDPDTGQYVDWDAEDDYSGYIREEDGKYVLAEMQGPGVISRIWSAQADQGGVEIYLDETLAISLPFESYFDGNTEPFDRSALVHTTALGRNNYVPIPYQESCKVLAESDYGQYYHFTYRTDPQQTILPTFNLGLSPVELEALDDANSILASSGIEPQYEGEVTEHVTVTIAPGETTRFLELSGKGALTAIRASMIFSGSIGSDEFYSYWYMPFEDSAVLELTNDGIVSRTLIFTIKHAPLSRPVEELGRFHAKWHRDAYLPTDPGREIDWTILKTDGRGRYCGAMLHVWNPGGGWWGEGDEKFFVDGEDFPSTFGTGTEDYFGYAWTSQDLFSNCYHNQTLCEGYHQGHISANRWHIADNVPFQQSFEGAIGKYFPNSRPTLYASTVYWYLAPGGTDYYQPSPVGERIGYWSGTARQKALRELALSIFWDGESSPSVWSPLGDFFGSAFGVNEYGSFPMGMRASAIEGEALTLLGTTGGSARTQDMSYWGVGWSKNAQLLWSGGTVSDTLDLSLPATVAGRYDVDMQLTTATDSAIVQLYLDGNALGGSIDLYSDGVAPTGELDLGAYDLTTGTHTLSVEILGANPQAVQSYTVGIDYIQLIAEESTADTAAPGTPQNLSAGMISSDSPDQVNLSWDASIDNVSVVGYRVFRDGHQLTTTTSITYFDTDVCPAAQYTYTVAAYDAAGNQSAHSEPVSVTTKTPYLMLHGMPADRAIQLVWVVSGTLPVTTTWRIAYYSQTIASSLTATAPLSTTRAYTLTGLTNRTWYTVALNAMLHLTPILTDVVHVMPTDYLAHLPVVLKED